MPYWEKNLKLQFLPSKESYYDYLRAVLGVTCLSKKDWGKIKTSFERIRPDLLDRFSANRSKYFRNSDKGETYLRAWHYSQLVLVLHAVARDLSLHGETELSERVYFAMVSNTACDIYYEVNLPIKTSCDHPLGAVIGRGRFEEKASFQFSSGCNLGNNNGVYPEISGNLLMLPGSTLVGKTFISGNVVLDKGAYLKDAGVIENKIAFGSHPNNIYKDLAPEFFDTLSMFSNISSESFLPDGKTQQ